jgi:DnaJ family protein B protein 12
VAAAKFCRKSISLYESKDAKIFLEELSDALATPISPSEAMPRDERLQASTGEPLAPARDDSERAVMIQKIRACRPTQYYEILGVARDCTDLEIKKAYRKVRVSHVFCDFRGFSSHIFITSWRSLRIPINLMSLVLLKHSRVSLSLCRRINSFPLLFDYVPVIARAWQVLGDPKLREQYDMAPDVDRMSRFPSQPSGNAQGFRGQDVTPEELFEMFFNGGFERGVGFNARPGTPTHVELSHDVLQLTLTIVFTAAFGPNRFHAYGPRPRPRNERNGNMQTTSSPFLQLLPLIILFAISFLGSLPSLADLFAAPDPGYSFSPSRTYSAERLTTNYRIPYYVNPQEFQSHPIYESIPEQSRNSAHAGPSSHMLRAFEAGIERGFVNLLRAGCNRESESKEARMHQHRGILGFLGNPEMVERIRQEPMPNCQRLSEIGLLGY